MGRPRGFSEQAVLRVAAKVFVRGGYEGTSIDDLVHALKLHRGSLYKAFGSKRGVFLAALQHLVRDDLPVAVAHPDGVVDADTLDLLLVAALELGPRDQQVRDLVARACVLLAEHGTGGQPEQPATLLGRRLLQRAGITQHNPCYVKVNN